MFLFVALLSLSEPGVSHTAKPGQPQALILQARCPSSSFLASASKDDFFALASLLLVDMEPKRVLHPKPVQEAMNDGIGGRREWLTSFA